MAGWNPWHGCHKISPGCQHCYVYRMDANYGRDSSVVTQTAAFRLPVQKKRNGEYKIADEEGPVNFLLYCAAIPVGLVITAAMIYDMVRPKDEPTNGKKKKKQQGKQR